MRKAMMVMVLVVAGGTISAQGAVLSTDTLDRIHWNSPTNLWSEGSGSYWTMDVSSFCNDPNDDESPAIGLQRTGPFYFGYRTDTGKVFSTVEVAAATHGIVGVPDGTDRLTLSWAAEGGALTVLAPAAVIDVGPTASAGWHQYVFQYNLGGLSADQIRITATDVLDYSPFFSSVKITLAPAPVTVQGTVVLENFVGDNTSAAAKLTFQPAVGDSIPRTAILGTAGTFSVDHIPQGDYTLTVRTAGWLAATRNITVATVPTTVLDPIVLQGADSNGDDQISFEDFSILQNGYGHSGTAGTNPAAAATGACGGLGILVLTILGLALWCRD